MKSFVEPDANTQHRTIHIHSYYTHIGYILYMRKKKKQVVLAALLRTIELIQAQKDVRGPSRHFLRLCHCTVCTGYTVSLGPIQVINVLYTCCAVYRCFCTIVLHVFVIDYCILINLSLRIHSPAEVDRMWPVVMTFLSSLAYELLYRRIVQRRSTS